MNHFADIEFVEPEERISEIPSVFFINTCSVSFNFYEYQGRGNSPPLPDVKAKGKRGIKSKILFKTSFPSGKLMEVYSCPESSFSFRNTVIGSYAVRSFSEVS